MMYVIYNNDGSIKSKFLNEFVMQGNSYENVLFVAFEGRSADNYTLYGEFRLPNGNTTTVLSGSTPQTKNIAGLGVYTGKCISLSNAETLVAGALQMNIKVITNDTERVLVSFNTYITINETGLQPSDPVIITAQEYQNLLSMIGNQVANYQTILKGISLASFGDLTDYQIGQALYVVNNLEAKLYEINSSYEAVLVVDLLDRYTKAEVDSLVGAKLSKSSSHNVVYATDNSGNQTTITYSQAVMTGEQTVAVRDTGGHVKTNTPSGQWDAANKGYVDEQIDTYAAYYITKNAAGDAFSTKAELNAASTFYSGGVVRVPTRNDYCIVLADETHNNETSRYIYNNGWEYQYRINETPFTQAQLDAINSGATATKINDIANKVNHVNSNNILYGTNGSAQDTTYTVSNANTGNTIPIRDASGNFKVGTPSNNDDAASKVYVDVQLSYKFDKSNILTTGSGESNTKVYSATYVRNQLQEIREIAEGKTRTFSTSTSCTVSDIEDAINDSATKVYYFDSGEWKAFTSVAEYTTWRTGKSIGLGSSLATRLNDITFADILPLSSQYYWIFDSNDDVYLITIGDYNHILGQNDNLMIIETDAADRWVFGSHLYALETAKLGYHALGTTSDPMPMISTSTQTSATPSLALDSLKTYMCTTALTSLTITAFNVSTNDNNPTWQISFKTHASTTFEITLPVGVRWDNGTPTFYLDTEYTIIIKKSVVSGEYIAYLC